MQIRTITGKHRFLMAFTIPTQVVWNILPWYTKIFLLTTMLRTFLAIFFSTFTVDPCILVCMSSLLDIDWIDLKMWICRSFIDSLRLSVRFKISGRNCRDFAGFQWNWRYQWAHDSVSLHLKTLIRCSGFTPFWDRPHNLSCRLFTYYWDSLWAFTLFLP